MYPQLAAAERSNSTVKRQLETVKEATAKKVKAAEQRAAQEKTKAATRDSDRRRKSQKSRWAGYQAGFAKGRTEGETEATAAAKAAFEEQLEEAEAERAVELEELTAERTELAADAKRNGTLAEAQKQRAAELERKFQEKEQECQTLKDYTSYLENQYCEAEENLDEVRKEISQQSSGWRDGDVVEEWREVETAGSNGTKTWQFDMRKRIIQLLAVGINPSMIGTVLEAARPDGSPAIIMPSVSFTRAMRSEMRIVVETLAARAAADPDVSELPRPTVDVQGL